MIERRTTATGDTRYDVRLRGPDGKERCRTFRTKQQAKAFEAAEIARRNRGDWIDPAESSRTFADVAAQWATSNPAKRPSSKARDDITLRRHLLPRFGTIAIGRIRPTDVQTWINDHAERRAPRTVQRDYGVLRAVMRYAVANQIIGRSPCTGAKLPRPERLDRPILTADQLARLVHELGNHGLMAHLGAMLGLRWGEVAALRIRSFDHEDGFVRITEQVVRDERGASTLDAPKSDAGVRTIAVPAALLGLVEHHLEVVHPDGAGSDDFLFPDSLGGHLAYSSWRSRVWDPAAVRAGLGVIQEDGMRYQGVTFHDLRRANATALVGSGVDVKTAQRRLGHSDVRLTLDIYAQAVSEADRAAADRLGAHFLPDGSVPDQA